MAIRLIEARTPRPGRGLSSERAAALVRDVTATLAAVRVQVEPVDERLELSVAFDSEASGEAIHQAFVVALATFRAATDRWSCAGPARLRVDDTVADAVLSRLQLPLSLYAEPQEQGTVRHDDGRIEVSLPDVAPDRLARLAAILVAELRERGDAAAIEAEPGEADPSGLCWRGLGERGRRARRGGTSVQRQALSLLSRLEARAELGLGDRERVMLREELTGAVELPADRQPTPAVAARELGVIPSRVVDPVASVIVAAHGEGHRVMLTVEAMRAVTSARYEVVVVDDGSPDGGCDFLREHPDDHPEVTLVTQLQQGSAVARNRGVEHARAPVVVFMDAHCFPREGWLEALLRGLEDPSVGITTPAISVAGQPDTKGYGLTIYGPRLTARWLGWPGPEPKRVPGAGAGCLAMRRRTFEAIGGFEPMRRYGLEDVELSIRCWRMGFDVVVDPRADVGHWFKERPTFDVPWTDYLYNVLRTAVLHFDGEPLRAVVEAAATDPCFGAAMSLLLDSDIWARRAWVRTRAVRDGSWYCRRFGIDLRS